MATNDIMKALQQEVCIDNHTEALICTAVLKQLDDRSNDVQSVAVKCLGVLVKTVHEAQITQICIRLCDLVLNGPEALRDVYSIGLKTLMSNVPPNMGDLLVHTLTSRLLVGCEHANDDIKRECLDSLTDLLKRFGHLMKADHEAILAQAIPHLTNPKAAIQKRAVVCLSSLATTLSDALLFSLMDQLLASIASAVSTPGKQSPADDKNLRVFIQTAGRIARSVGHRLGAHVARVVPQLLQCLGDFDGEDMQTDAGNELRENCFPGLESFVLRCPREVAEHVAPILHSALQFMKFDPNYCYDDEEEQEGGGDHDDEEAYDDDYDDAAVSDDDDSSWKVRKAALRVILAVIRERDEVLQDQALFTCVCDELLGRFKEREESVQLEVFGCVNQLLEEALHAMPRDGAGAGADSSDVAPPSLTRSQSSDTGATHARVATVVNVNVDRTAMRAYLETKLPFVLRTATKLLLQSTTSSKVKSSLFLLLRRLLAAMQGSVPAAHMDGLMTTLLATLNGERNQVLKLDCLTLLMDVFQLHAPATVQGYIPSLLPEIFSAARDDWYKLVSASLKLLGVLIAKSRQSCWRACARGSGHMEVDDEGAPAVCFDLSPHFQDLYNCVYPRLEALDVDQEIKEASISCTGQLLGVLGDVFPPPLVTNLAQLLLKRVDNEITRIAALKAITFVASSPVECSAETSAVLSSGAVAAITPFLRQQSRMLKQTTLRALSAILSLQRNLQVGGRAGTASLSTQTVCDLLKELSQLLLTSDMNITDLGLQVIIQLMQSCQCLVECEPAVSAALVQDVLPKALELSISPLMQGVAQQSLIELLCNFFLVPALRTSFAQLKKSLLSFVERGHGETGGEYAPLPMQSIANLSKCITGICGNISVQTRRETIVEFLNELGAPPSSAVAEARQLLALLCIGRMGENLDVSHEPELAGRLKAVIMECFEGGSEDVRAATAFALGRLAVGSMPIFLPIVLDACTSGDDNKHQYLLLVALKETIVVHVTSSVCSLSFTPYLETVLPGLLNLARTSHEEGVRNMVAECLGALASIHTEAIISLLQQTAQAEHDNKLLVWTVATSMRFFFSRVALSSAHAHIDAQPFLVFLQDPDLDVRRAALLMINAAVHYTPTLVQPHLESLVLPHMLVLLSYKQKREVQMGPFKHIVDDALPLRKGALTCYETMLYVMPDAVNPSDLLAHLTILLVDNLNETNLQCHQILCKLCSVAPSATLCAIEGFIEPLLKIITKYEKLDAAEGSDGPEKERALEQVRSCVRLISCVNKLENLDVSQLWQGFVSRLQQKPCIAVLLTEHEAQGLREKGM